MPRRRILVRMLGGFEVVVDERAVPTPLWRRHKAAALVKLLALAPRNRIGREKAMDALWPELSPARAGANLRKTAYHVRGILDASDVVVLDGSTVQIGPGWELETDVEDFEQAASRALADHDPEACRAAAGLYGGELLPEDLYDDWCETHRIRLAGLYTRVLEQGRLWGRLVEVDPVNERAHQAIISSHLDNRDRAAALRQFEDLRTSLRDRLGVLPNEQSMALYEEALSLDAPDVPTPAERARALLAWGVVHWERRDAHEAERTALEARSLAIDAGLGRELAEASELLGLIAYAQGRWREMFSAELMAAMGRTPELTPFLFDAHMCMSEFALCETDGVRVVADLAAEILSVAGDAGSRQGKALGHLLRGEATILEQEVPERARPDLEKAAGLYEDLGSLTGLTLANERIAQLESAAGHPESAGERHRRALELATVAPTSRHLVPFVFGAMIQDADETRYELVRQGEQSMTGLDICQPCAMGFRIAAVHVCASEGRLVEARGYLAQAEKVAAMWSGGVWHAAVAEARAAVRAREGANEDEVAALLNRAADEFSRSSRPRDEARCRAAIADIGSLVRER